MTAFARRVEAATGRNFASYEDLHAWSIDDAGAFWSQVWEHTGVRASRLADTPAKDLARFPGATWFDGARLNYAENLLRFRDGRTALVSYLENGNRKEITYAELHRQTLNLAVRLAEHGIGPGDRVAGWLPNTIEAIVAMLATTALGGVWSSCSPDFGADGALDRFGQIEPKVLFACDGYFYNGKRIDIRNKVRRVVARVPSLRQVVWTSVIGEPCGPDVYDDWIEQTPARPGNHAATEQPDAPEPTTPRFEQVDFNHPLYILYSSGTTGPPKCIVHGVGGTLLQHLKEHQIHLGLTRADTLFFFTTCGWMMWNWLASALASGCTVVLYDGSPFYPDAGALWDLAEREGVTVFGVSAKYLSAIDKSGLQPRASHNLAKLRTLLSTGSTLSHEGFRYVYRDIKTDVQLVSMTGGTDLISCFHSGQPKPGGIRRRTAMQGSRHGGRRLQ